LFLETIEEKGTSARPAGLIFFSMRGKDQASIFVLQFCKNYLLLLRSVLLDSR